MWCVWVITACRINCLIRNWKVNKLAIRVARSDAYPGSRGESWSIGCSPFENDLRTFFSPQFESLEIIWVCWGLLPKWRRFLLFFSLALPPNWKSLNGRCWVFDVSTFFKIMSAIDITSCPPLVVCDGIQTIAEIAKIIEKKPNFSSFWFFCFRFGFWARLTQDLDLFTLRRNVMIGGLCKEWLEWKLETNWNRWLCGCQIRSQLLKNEENCLFGIETSNVIFVCSKNTKNDFQY